jgi:hypothetical protein
MKLQKTTIVLVLLALGLGSVVLVSELRGSQQGQEQASGQRIFNFEESQVQALTLKTAGQTLEFAKTAATNAAQPTPSAKPSPDQKATESPKATSKWQLQAPVKAPADDASVAYLLSLLATGRSDRALKVPAAQKAEFGLDQPSATIEIKLQNQQTHRLVLGKSNFNGSFLYAQANPPATTPAEISVLLVSTDFNNAVNRPLSEWQAKPETPQPQPSPESSPSPTTSPEAEASPSPASEPAPTPETPETTEASPQADASPSPTPSP